MRLLNYIIYLYLLFVPAILYGQVKLKGNIVDEANVPLPFVTVSVLAEKDTTLCGGCITDSLGNYEIQIDRSKYMVRYSLIGYETYSISLDIQSDEVRNVVLKSRVHELQDIIIHANRLPFKLTNLGLFVDVQNSLLKNETKFENILKRIPGMIEQNGNLIYFGKGAVSYYIDDIEIQDISEIRYLSVEDVKSIQLLTSPGSRYAADKRVVVLIKTKKRMKGVTLKVDANASLGRLLNHYEGLNLHYQNRDLHLFGAYKYSDIRTKTPSSSLQTTYADTIWCFSNEMSEKNVIGEHYFQGGFDYIANKWVEFGGRYTGKVSETHKYANQTISATANNIHYATLRANNDVVPRQQSHHINIYLNIHLNNNVTLKWYSDYIYKKEKQKGVVREVDSKLGEENIDYRSKMGWNIWATNLQLTYCSPWGEFAVGYTNGTNKGYNEIHNVRILNNGKTKDSENKHALFFNYNWEKGKFALGIGGRYEFLYSILTDTYLNSQDGKKKYSNFFPSLNMSYSSGNWMHSVGYVSSIDRPAFDLLNKNVIYVNRFNYQKGNANLRPTILHDINYSLFYKFIYLNVCYTYAKNRISTGFHAEKGNSSIMISYPENFERTNDLIAIVNLQHSFKRWDTSLTTTCMKSFFHYQSIYGLDVKAHQPIVIFKWANDFNLPKNFTASLNGTYGMGGDLYMIQMKPYSSIDFKIQKWLLAKKLFASLEVYDLFGKDYSRCITRLNNISMDIVSRTDNRKVGVTFVYYFNSRPAEYKGTSAVQEELRRLYME